MENIDIMEIDPKMLNPFFNIQLKVRARQLNSDGELEEKVMRTHFRRCTVDDFITKGLIIPQESRIEYTKRICPEIYPIKQQFIIKNGYANSNDRISFSIEIAKCNQENYGVKC